MKLTIELLKKELKIVENQCDEVAEVAARRLREYEDWMSRYRKLKSRAKDIEAEIEKLKETL